MTSSGLGDFEQLVLLAVMQIDDDAYAASVRDEIALRTGREVARGAVHVTLDRLEQKGFLRSATGVSTTERGGRPRRVFSVTASGKRALRETLDALGEMLRGLPGEPAWGTR